MITVYTLIFILTLPFIITPLFIAFGERDMVQINELDLVNKLGKLIKQSDAVYVSSGKKIKIPINYTLNNNILLLTDRQEEALLEELTEYLKRNFILLSRSNVKVGFSNKRNHPYNFVEIWIEKEENGNE